MSLLVVALVSTATGGGQPTRTGLAIFLGVTVIAGVLVLILLGQRAAESSAGRARSVPEPESTSPRRETTKMVQRWTAEAGNGGRTAERASEGVAAILRAAEAAAADIRQAAEDEADAIRQRANEESAAAAAEVARRRREVDAYAQARREDAELEATRIRKEAAAAAKETERAARARHRDLVVESERLRKWLQDSIAPMQDTIGRLETVLAVDDDQRPRRARAAVAVDNASPAPAQGAPAS